MLSKAIRLTIFTLAFSLAATASAANYVPPTTQPPSCPAGTPGCESPVHTGQATQFKNGIFGVNILGSFFDAFFAIEGGQVGIGYAPSDTDGAEGVISPVDPDLKLGVNGLVGAQGYCDMLGENCFTPGDPNPNGGASDSKWSTSTNGTSIFNNNGGNVGVGTSQPEDALHVAGNTDSPGRPGMMISQSGTGDAGIRFRVGTVAGYALGIDNSINDNFSISIGSGLGSINPFVISTNLNPRGNVGIGTNDPTHKLTVITGAEGEGARISDTPNDNASSPGAGAIIGRAGKGVEAYSFYSSDDPEQAPVAFIGTASGNNGIGFIGHAYGGGTTYGSKSIANSVGSFTRGHIGLYATNEHGSELPAGWIVPNDLVAPDATSYAAYVAGPLKVKGNPSSDSITVRSDGVVGIGRSESDVQGVVDWSNTIEGYAIDAVLGDTTAVTLTSGFGLFGALQIKDGNEGAGKVLTSDANGTATWQTPSGSTSLNNEATRLQTVGPTRAVALPVDLECDPGEVMTGVRIDNGAMVGIHCTPFAK